MQFHFIFVKSYWSSTTKNHPSGASIISKSHFNATDTEIIGVFVKHIIYLLCIGLKSIQHNGLQCSKLYKRFWPMCFIVSNFDSTLINPKPIDTWSVRVCVNNKHHSFYTLFTVCVCTFSFSPSRSFAIYHPEIHSYCITTAKVCASALKT